MSGPPYRIYDQQYAASDRPPEPLEPVFVQGVCEICPVQTIRITKNRRGLLERDPVLLEVLDGLSDVPREHIIVYT